MNFNRHSELEGRHATLSASQWRWINYDEERMYERFASSYATEIGTLIHELAADLIKCRIKLSKTDKKIVLLHLLKNHIPDSVIDIDFLYENLANYVNEAIGYRMVPELVLKYSYNCFGTADAINPLDNIYKNRLLRIHDLKTGVTPAHMEQLKIYAALFCLEYNIKPGDIDMELRIYQAGDIIEHNPSADEILPIMDKIISMDKFIDHIREA